MKKINYGIDGPKFVTNLFILTIIFYGIGLNIPAVKIGSITINLGVISIIGGSLCLAEGLLMLLYTQKGKFKHRERMLKLVEWNGNETVLDVGTGLGLLMIGAAKKLTTGKSIGIDIWNKDDLSQNSSVKAASNAMLEEVADRIEIKEENILNTNFQDNYFDVILSNLCLHNVGNRQNRKTACKEIHRILKKAGVAVISDFIHCNEYEAAFRELGMTVEKIRTVFFNTYQPLTIVKAIKN